MNQSLVPKTTEDHDEEESLRNKMMKLEATQVKELGAMVPWRTRSSSRRLSASWRSIASTCVRQCNMATSSRPSATASAWPVSCAALNSGPRATTSCDLAKRSGLRDVRYSMVFVELQYLAAYLKETERC